MSEAWAVKVNANLLEGLTLRLMDCHAICQGYRKLDSIHFTW